MAQQLGIFVAMYFISFIAHQAAHKAKQKAALAADGHKVSAVVAIAAQPSSIDAVKEFVVHIVVYSGQFFPAH